MITSATTSAPSPVSPPAVRLRRLIAPPPPGRLKISRPSATLRAGTDTARERRTRVARSRRRGDNGSSSDHFIGSEHAEVGHRSGGSLNLHGRRARAEGHGGAVGKRSDAQDALVRYHVVPDAPPSPRRPGPRRARSSSGRAGSSRSRQTAHPEQTGHPS